MADKCPECGSALLAGSRFCHICGWDQRLPAAGKASASAPGRPAWKRRTMAAVSLISLLLLLVLISLPGQAGSRAVLPGQAAPDFSLQLLDGGQVSLSELRGKPVVLNFWATWCPPCRKEMPLLEATWRRYRESGLVVLALNLTEGPVVVRAFRDRYGLNFPIALDSEGKVTDLYRIIPLPTTFFIDRNGNVVSKVEGELEPSHLAGEVARLLAGSGAPPPQPIPEPVPEIRGSPASNGGPVNP